MTVWMLSILRFAAWKLSGFTVLATGVLVAPVTTAEGKDLYGAIAFSQETDGSYATGMAWNHDSRSAAAAGAIAKCWTEGGSYCSEAGWFRNACGALAIGGSNGFGSGWGDSKGMAERKALSGRASLNDRCRIVASQCAHLEEERKWWVVNTILQKNCELPSYSSNIGVEDVGPVGLSWCPSSNFIYYPYSLRWDETRDFALATEAVACRLRELRNDGAPFSDLRNMAIDGYSPFINLQIALKGNTAQLIESSAKETPHNSEQGGE